MRALGLKGAVITMSDSRSASAGKADLSGETACRLLQEAGYELIHYELISDDLEGIKETLVRVCQLGPDLLLTTGGTGLSPRDNTPEATRAIIQKEVPGISEAMRWNGLQITPRAMLSRGISGIRDTTLIINLPGSPKAVRENLDYILDHLAHGLQILRQEARECAK